MAAAKRPSINQMSFTFWKRYVNFSSGLFEALDIRILLSLPIYTFLLEFGFF